MKTDELIVVLAAGAGPAPRAVAARRLAPAVLIGLVASAALALVTLGLAPGLGSIGVALWIKLGYAVALAGAAAWLTARLARPLARTRAALAAVVVVLGVMAWAGIAASLGTPELERLPYVMGESSVRCAGSVFAFSLPALAALLWAVRGLAPTRLRLAGLAAGLLAGAVGALGYAFTCSELSIAFIALWYTLGVGMTAALGAAVGGRALRW